MSAWRNVLYVVAHGETDSDWTHWPFHAVDVRDQGTALCGLKPAKGWGVKVTKAPSVMSICGQCADIERPRKVAT